MAERRMFAKSIIDSDSFLDMPLTTQALYFHLSMRADDEGFINNPKKIMRMIGAGNDEIKVLISKGFLIPFESGIVVIRHWRIHNYIQKDRFKPTAYQEEKAQISVDSNGTYETDTECIQDVYTMDTQVRLGKDSKGKDNKDICSEPQAASEPPVITLPLNDKSEYPITQSMVDEWATLYPAVDVMQQLRSMRGWCNGNPTKKKTKGGILRFVTNWLSREQDKSHSTPAPKKSSCGQFGYENQRKDDLSALEKKLFGE